MNRLLVLLQNPYSRRGWNPSTWRRDLAASRTGVRLGRAVPDTPRWEVRYANASPFCGRRPDAYRPHDPTHVRRVLRRSRPDVVLACGVSAARAAGCHWEGALLVIPHPASRVLTNQLLDDARTWLVAWSRRKPNRREAFRQCRGRVERVSYDLWVTTTECRHDVPGVRRGSGRGVLEV